MDQQKDGGAAFPAREVTMMNVTEDGSATPIYSGSPGMSLRDWFAGKALPHALLLEGSEVSGRPITTEEMAEYAYAIADAMLAARAK